MKAKKSKQQPTVTFEDIKKYAIIGQKFYNHVTSEVFIFDGLGETFIHSHPLVRFIVQPSTMYSSNSLSEYKKYTVDNFPTYLVKLHCGAVNNNWRKYK